jgi:hypothetical protein
MDRRMVVSIGCGTGPRRVLVSFFPLLDVGMFDGRMKMM